MADVAPSRVSTPSAGMREISLSISASSSAAAHAGPPPTTIAAGGSAGRERALLLRAPRLRLRDRARRGLGRAREQRAQPVVAGHPRPQREPGAVRARERLRVRDRALVLHVLEHRRVGGARQRGLRASR